MNGNRLARPANVPSWLREHLGLRIRLTLLFAVLAVVLAAAVQIIHGAYLDRQLAMVLDHDLGEDVQAYGEGTADATTMAGLLEASRMHLSRLIDEPTARIELWRLEFSDGTSLEQPASPALGDRLARIAADARGGQPMLPEAGLLLTTSDGAADALRAVVAPIRLGGRVVGTLVVAEPVPANHAVLDEPAFALSLFALVPAICLAYLLVRRSLAPIRRITETAAAISEEVTDRRIGYRGPNDEVGRLASTLDAMLDRLRLASRQRSAFYSVASHELRTPLTIARGHLEVLRRSRRISRAEINEAVDIALEEIERVTSAVSDMLLLGRMAQGVEVGSEPVDLEDLVREVHRRARTLASRDWRLGRCERLVVRGDREQLNRALLNLISNAVRHTQTGDRIELSCRAVNGLAIVTVADSGCGIAPGDLPHIWEPWYHRSEPQDDQGGAGLGLTIVREVIRGHGGRVEVHSQLGAGSVFAISLPLDGRERRSGRRDAPGTAVAGALRITERVIANGRPASGKPRSRPDSPPESPG